MVDSGLCHYSMIRSSVVRRLNLQRTPLPSPRPLTGFDGPRDARTHYMVKLDIDVGGHRLEGAYAYEVDNLDYDLMLGISWLAEQNILLDARNRMLVFPNGDRVHEDDVHRTMELKQISANAYDMLRKSSRRNSTNPDRVAIYSASLADNIVTKLRDARDWAEASMASAQQDQEDRTNEQRDPAEQYKVGDLVWLNLKNIRTTRPSRTLDYRHAKYKVLEVVGSHNYRLNTPPGIHDVFHTSLLRRAATDPFPSQKTSDWQPPGIVGEDNELEWEIEEILDERPRGRGRQFLVKWVGYDRPSWTAGSALAETAALDRWEALSSEGGA
ncbi:hypothetical protein ACJ73_10094 [Blastomyces percursus]|uniref:Chromo domain-containing protein n=1 Tax=Blastomyces percursus TaxID=1658174 RepID=A0A1J9P0P2_9EURO|nr:hypothetical protein ACJ73_10094 [Blastomyces percursus]